MCDHPSKPRLDSRHSIQVLRQASHPDWEAQVLDIHDSTYGAIFLGTPHRGSALTPWGTIGRNLAVAIGQDTNDKNLKDLRLDSEILELLREEFALLLSRNAIKVRTFQEGRGIAGVFPLHMKARVPFPPRSFSSLTSKTSRWSVLSRRLWMLRISARP